MRDERREDEQAQVIQPPLFELGRDGKLRGTVGLLPVLTAESSLDVARFWFRRYLEQSGHPVNTVKSYSYDLAVFESLVGPKPIAQIDERDVATFLEQSRGRSTRKRRLTTLSTFFKFLITRAKVIEHDPTAAFYSDRIPLKTPQPLFPEEQERLLAAAAAEGPRTHLAIWLMLRLGLSRHEVLTLRASHIDWADPDRPVVYVFAEGQKRRLRERKLAGNRELTEIYQRLLEEEGPQDRLVPILPQSLNKLVERVAAAAGIQKPVSPQTLRHTFAVEQAKRGASEDELLELLGLADDARNRLSVRRYIRLAAPPLDPLAGSRESRVT
ncbi:tyrosine-type recombinase/integrase [Thermomicrobium sp. 4228-Ro]|uniref:tyrosine-type recombinase/integrase n=1 Tax=Thermomicrobium sp. 4228-Ro TaxID=2993937 RepID=UPI002248C1A7|nr:tyrosine-type recombinase/integrase [Thermomicrobium sp. 4228-Ro]MCX2726559.1 tyrosine-type recombinase/integrase [Thermomicrobium sp. 4228-Ro]